MISQKEFDDAMTDLVEAEAEIERLRAENEQLLEQILLRTPSVMEKDMQEIMRINNQLLADNAELLAVESTMDDQILKLRQLLEAERKRSFEWKEKWAAAIAKVSK